jgi:hypothetical protein
METIAKLLNAPIERLQLVDNFHDDLVVILWMENFKLLILKGLKIGVFAAACRE